jgi:hypothetical protein
MKMKFKVKATDLNSALDVVSVVRPSPSTAQEAAGYLFVINNGEQAHLYSRDTSHVIKCNLPISAVEGEGAFVYPAEYVDAFRFLGDQEVTFTAESDEVNGTYKVAYETESGAAAEHTSFNPKLMMTYADKELSEAKDECSFDVGVIRESLGMARPFTKEEKAENAKPQFKTIQVFDAATNEAWRNGDGYMFAADGVRAFFFYSEAFKGKKFKIQTGHVSFLNSFLAKCEGLITFKESENYTFAVSSNGSVLGWSKETAAHEKFKYYALKTDQFVLKIAKSALLNALKHTRSELDRKKDKVQFHYDAAPYHRVWLTTNAGTSKSSSVYVTAQPVENAEKTAGAASKFSFGLNLDDFIQNIGDIRANEVELRVQLREEGGKVKAALRTIDEFSMTKEGRVASPTDKDVIPCRVTRFMPSKE